MSVLEKLTEGLVNRDLQKQGAALMDKWEATGLLEGLGNDQERTNMAHLRDSSSSWTSNMKVDVLDLVQGNLYTVVELLDRKS